MNITQTIENICNQYYKVLELTTKKINNGQCSNFADDLEFAGFGVAVWGDADWLNWSPDIKNYPDWFTHFAPYHCFVWHKDRYYDSECSQGCEYADQLPFYQRQKWMENTKHRLAEIMV
ncbi:hypothetical protein KAR91_74260 [Candidatus Pacearchaeota archaeon]|nr:hypothetical protein [Candidatus Pacearchaeota archaeon]